MATKMITLRCPSCQASVQVNGDKEYAFCEYCGSKILIYDDNHHRETRTYRQVDEADIIRAATEQQIHLHDLEVEDERESMKQQYLGYGLGFGAVVSIIGIITLIIGLSAAATVLSLGILLVVVCACLLFADRPKTTRTVFTSQTREQQPQVQPQQQAQSQTIYQNNFYGQQYPYVKPKDKYVALLLCGLFGYFGAHKFYEGKYLVGIVYLCTMGLFGIGWIIDIFKILGRPRYYYV